MMATFEVFPDKISHLFDFLKAKCQPISRHELLLVNILKYIAKLIH